MIFSVPFSFAFIVSLLIALVIVVTQRLHGHFTHDNRSGVQKLHAAPTPRIGGVAIFVGGAVGGISLPVETQELWWMLGLSALPAFAVGLIEDLTKTVSVKLRLMATIFSGVIFCLVTDYQIRSVDIPGVDWILSFWLPSLLFTAFAIGGIANAINIIDGVNGLASGTAIIILVGFAIVSWQANDLPLLAACLVTIGSLSGFFLLNFPQGRIFLGDAGAYAIGFALAAIAVLLPQRNPELSPLIGLLALSYPVTETLVSIHRRLVREGTHPGQPDRLHLHSLIYRSRARKLAQLIGAPHLRNALTGLVLMGLPLMSSGLMIMFGQDTLAIALCVCLIAGIYLLTYRKVALLLSHQK